MGFEPETDFVILPWISGNFKGDTGNISDRSTSSSFYKEGTVLTGCNVLWQKDSVRFFGKIYPVSASLSKSGSGLDNAVFVSMKTLSQIYSDAKNRGFGFISDGNVESKVSAVFVQLSEDAKADSVAIKISTKIPDVSVVKRDSLVSEISSRLNSIFFILKILAVMMTVLIVISLAVIFPLTVSSRKSEFSFLKILGASHSKCAEILLCEAIFISLAGGVFGILFASLIEGGSTPPVN